MPSRQPPAKAAQSEHDIGFQLGQLTARVHEMIHQNNDEAQKSIARDRIMTKLEDVPGDIKEIKNRLTNLEMDKAQRDGERGIVGSILKSPTLQWLAVIAVAVWTYLKGHGQ